MESYDYSYKIKIINSSREKKAVTKQLYKLNDKFTTLADMKYKLKTELKEKVI